MNKPRYMEELLKTIFLWLGVAFIALGLLCFIGILKPSAHSMVQEPALLGVVYVSLGAFFFLIQMILKGIASSKSKLHHELLISGTERLPEPSKKYICKSTRSMEDNPPIGSFILTPGRVRFIIIKVICYGTSQIWWNKIQSRYIQTLQENQRSDWIFNKKEEEIQVFHKKTLARGFR